MSITEALRNYFHQFRLIDWAFQVEENLESSSGKRSVDEDAAWQKDFMLTSLDKFSEGQLLSAEHLQDWLESQNRRKYFPKLPDGKETLRLECLGADYLCTNVDEPGHYQVTIRLTYR